MVNDSRFQESSNDGLNREHVPQPPRSQLAMTRTCHLLMACGKWLMIGAWAAVVATASQMWRLVQYAFILGRHSVLQRTFHQTQLTLGEELYRDGVGDENIRREIQHLDEQIADARAAKRPATTYLAQRRRLHERLAQSSLAASQGKNSGGAYDRAASLQYELADAREAIRSHKRNLLAHDRHERQRIAIGFGMILLLVVGGFALLSGWQDGEDGGMDSAAEANFQAMETSKSMVESSEEFSNVTREAVPPEAVTTPNNSAIVPGTETDDEIAGLVTEPTSFEYTEAGFRMFRFGASLETVRSMADGNEVPLREGRQKFIVAEGKLIGYERLYLDDNKGYLDQFREIFGAALKDNVSEALATRQGSTMDMRGNLVGTAERQETLCVRYYFPSSIAYLEATWLGSAQGMSAFRREHLLFNIFDRAWVNARLSEHVSDCRRALEWVSQMVADENGGALKVADVPDFPGAKREYKAPGGAVPVETLKLLNKEGKEFIAVRRAMKDLYNFPQNSISIGIHLRAMPGSSNPLYRYKFLGIEVDRCNSLIAQCVFPPRGTTIETQKSEDSYEKSFIWRTSNGWRVTVSPGNHIYVANIPEKGL